MNFAKKKWGAAALAAVLALGIAGCGDSGDTAKKADGKVQVTFWHVYLENFGAPAIKDMVDEFNKSQDKIEVKAVYNPDMYPGLMQNLQAEVAAGKYPSMVMIGYNYLKYFDQNFQYVSPTQLCKDVPGDADYLSTNFMPNILELAQVEDRQVGVPYSISAPILYYNADLYRQAGLDPDQPPVTWDDVRAHAKAIKEATGNYGFYMQEYQDNWSVQGLLESNGARMLSEDGKTATFASPESAEAYQLLRDMVIEDKSALHMAADEGIASFSSGKVGILAGTSAKIGTISSAVSFDLRGTTYPIFGGKERRLPVGGNFIAITAQDPEVQKASWEFLKFMMKEQNLAKWTIETGYLPPRPEAREDEALKAQIAKSEPLRAAFEEMDTLAPWAAFPGDVGVRAEKMFADARDRILGGKATVMDALQQAQDELNKLLK